MNAFDVEAWLSRLAAIRDYYETHVSQITDLKEGYLVKVNHSLSISIDLTLS